MSNPGATKKIENRVTRRSNGARCGFLLLRVVELMRPGLEPILFHPPIERATAETERFCCLAHVTLKALQRLAYQDTFDRLQTQFFETLCLRFLRTQSEIPGLDLVSPAHEHCALHGVFQFTDISWPGILKKGLQRCGFDPLHWAAIPRRIL